MLKWLIYAINWKAGTGHTSLQQYLKKSRQKTFDGPLQKQGRDWGREEHRQWRASATKSWTATAICINGDVVMSQQ